MSVHAKVLVTLEIDSDSSWADDTTMGQVVKQAKDDIAGKLRRMQREVSGIRLAGDFKVTSIWVPPQQ